MEIKIIIREEVFIQGLPDSLIEFFRQDNTFSNPKKAQMVKMFGRYLDAKNGDAITDPAAKREFFKKRRNVLWLLGKIQADIPLWRQSGDWLALPRGYLQDAVAKINSFGFAPVVEDRTICPMLEISPLDPTGRLYDYQETALNDLMRNPTGVMEAPVGAGKTNILLTLAARLQTPTLVLVHTTELLKQTVARCTDWLGFEPGVIGGGKNTVKDVTIGMIQSLQRIDIDKYHPLYSRFGCFISDEVQHIPSASWSELIRKFPCRYKYGFSATAWRKDRTEFLIWRMIGPITAKVMVSTVIDAGKIMWPSIQVIPTDYYFEIAEGDSSAWGPLMTDLISNQDRNNLIIRTVAQHLDAEPDSKALVLTDRIQHAKTLTNMMQAWNPVSLHGEMKTSERNVAMEAIRAGAGLTIATIHLMGEGVNVPGWSSLFLTTPIAGGPRTIQAIGRIARAAPGKDTALLFDFVDKRIPILQAAAWSRWTLYKNKGEKKRKL